MGVKPQVKSGHCCKPLESSAPPFRVESMTESWSGTTHTGRTDREMCLALTFSAVASSACIGGGLSEGVLLSEERAFGNAEVYRGLVSTAQAGPSPSGDCASPLPDAFPEPSCCVAGPCTTGQNRLRDLLGNTSPPRTGPPRPDAIWLRRSNTAPAGRWPAAGAQLARQQAKRLPPPRHSTTSEPSGVCSTTRKDRGPAITGCRSRGSCCKAPSPARPAGSGLTERTCRPARAPATR
jgi:hypothetical protein